MSVYAVGQEVEIFSESSGGWQAGEVSGVRADGAVNVRYAGNQKLVPLQFQGSHLRPSGHRASPAPGHYGGHGYAEDAGIPGALVTGPQLSGRTRQGFAMTTQHALGMCPQLGLMQPRVGSARPAGMARGAGPMLTQSMAMGMPPRLPMGGMPAMAYGGLGMGMAPVGSMHPMGMMGGGCMAHMGGSCMSQYGGSCMGQLGGGCMGQLGGGCPSRAGMAAAPMASPAGRWMSREDLDEQRRPAGPSGPGAALYSVDDEVMIHSESKNGWVMGRVTKVDNHGAVTVVYEQCQKAIPVEHQSTHLKPAGPMHRGSHGHGQDLYSRGDGQEADGYDPSDPRMTGYGMPDTRY